MHIFCLSFYSQGQTCCENRVKELAGEFAAMKSQLEKLTSLMNSMAGIYLGLLLIRKQNYHTFISV